MVAWIAAAPSVASRNAARTAAAVSAWIRWLTSGQRGPGRSARSRPGASRWSARIRAWNANPVRVRRAANSSSRRTDQEASAVGQGREAAADLAQVGRQARGRGRVARAPPPRRPAARAAGRGRAGPGRAALARDAARARPDDVLGEGRGEARVAALRLEARVAGGEPVRAQDRAERERRVGQAHGGQAALVDGDDPPPLRVDVDLGHRDRGSAARRASRWRGTPAPGADSSVEASVTNTSASADGQEGQGRGRMGGVQPADARACRRARSRARGTGRAGRPRRPRRRRAGRRRRARRPSGRPRRPGSPRRSAPRPRGGGRSRPAPVA